MSNKRNMLTAQESARLLAAIKRQTPWDASLCGGDPTVPPKDREAVNAAIRRAMR